MYIAFTGFRETEVVYGGKETRIPLLSVVVVLEIMLSDQNHQVFIHECRLVDNNENNNSNKTWK